MNLKRIKRFLGVAIFACGLLLANQLFHIHTLYAYHKIEYTDKSNTQIRNALTDFNLQSVNRHAVFDYQPTEKQLIFTFNRLTLHRYYLDSIHGTKYILEQECYDVRDTSKWHLRNLQTYLRTRLDTSIIHPASMQFLLRDSSNEIKETFPAQIKNPITPVCEITLGNMTQDRLYIAYPYPPLLFWHEAGDRVLLAVCLFAIVALCVVVLYKTVKREKLEAHYQELYVHSVVHDLKRPIANQIALQESILPEIPEPYKSIAGQGMEQMQDTLKSINRMLLQSTDAHGLRLKIERFDLRELLQSLSRPEQWRTTRGKRFQIDVDYRAASPWIDGDPNFLHAVFYNLIDNSLKYSGPEVRVAITCADADNRRVRVAFADNGDGISPAALRHIFDRYNRGDHQGDKSVKGHGQGLHYARLVIKAHRGSIAIDSAPAAGTTVTVTLPADIPHSQKQRHHWN